MNYNLVRSKRKTISLKITESCELEVRAPKRMATDQIENFVRKHQAWVESRIQQMRQSQQRKDAFQVAFGEKYLMLGDYYPLIPVKQSDFGFNGKGFYADEEFTKDQLKKGMVSLYRDLARNLLIKKTVDYGQKMGVFPLKLKINKARTRWGSCSSSGNLNFSWYLIMAEESAIDYVVVHELAHLIQMNHSTEFWEIVEGYCPDYLGAKEKLKCLQTLLADQNWE
ncbi:SprT family zinc-dependent metalloprotease [Eubacteriaceae bacterium ES3]|nr:SprT family zinc-dependent metalloprotease [Eubacteriaceae bacterium ES3]